MMGRMRPSGHAPRSRSAAAALFLALSLGACGDDGGAGGPAGGTGAATGGSGASSGAGGEATGGQAGGGGGAGGAGATGGGGGISGGGGEPTGGAGGAGVPLDGFGDIAGRCGLIDPADLTSSAPGWVENSLDFQMMPFDYAALSTGGQKVHDDGNLGGSSLYSEIFAYEMLYRCELAALLMTEGEIEYLDEMGKKTDLLVEVDGLTIGVSVTRAVGFPPDAPYTVGQATSLLEGKLDDIVLSTANAHPNNAWEKQILHVLAYAEEHRVALETAYASLPTETKADTIVIVTVTHGDDDFVYF